MTDSRLLNGSVGGRRVCGLNGFGRLVKIPRWRRIGASGVAHLGRFRGNMTSMEFLDPRQFRVKEFQQIMTIVVVGENGRVERCVSRALKLPQELLASTLMTEGYPDFLPELWSTMNHLVPVGADVTKITALPRPSAEGEVLITAVPIQGRGV